MLKSSARPRTLSQWFFSGEDPSFCRVGTRPACALLQASWNRTAAIQSPSSKACKTSSAVAPGNSREASSGCRSANVVRTDA